MAVEIMAGVSLFKSMLDTAKGLKDINDAAVRNTAVIDLQEKILAAQAAQMALIERLGQLEDEITKRETWDREKQRYELEKLPPGVLIYKLKADSANGEPLHSICANCYNKETKSLLHVSSQGNGLTNWKCHACGFDERTGNFQQPSLESDDEGGWMAR